MAAVWSDRTKADTATGTGARVGSGGSGISIDDDGPRGPVLYAVPSIGLADVDGRIERLLARLGSDDPFAGGDDDEVAVAERPSDRRHAEPEPGRDAPADAGVLRHADPRPQVPVLPDAQARLERRIEDCVELHRQQAQEVREELASQRADLRRGLHDGLGVLQARFDRVQAGRRAEADARHVATGEALAACRRDLDGIVSALRAVSVGTREQGERLADAAVAANLRLREDVEQTLRESRIDAEHRLERLERTVARRAERDRRFVMSVAIGLGLLQVAGFATLIVLG